MGHVGFFPEGEGGPGRGESKSVGLSITTLGRKPGGGPKQRTGGLQLFCLCQIALAGYAMAGFAIVEFGLKLSIGKRSGFGASYRG